MENFGPVLIGPAARVLTCDVNASHTGRSNAGHRVRKPGIDFRRRTPEVREPLASVLPYSAPVQTYPQGRLWRRHRSVVLASPPLHPSPNFACPWRLKCQPRELHFCLKSETLRPQGFGTACGEEQMVLTAVDSFVMKTRALVIGVLPYIILKKMDDSFREKAQEQYQQKDLNPRLNTNFCQPNNLFQRFLHPQSTP